MFIFPCLICPRWVNPSQCTSKKGEESSGRKASCPDPGFQTTPSVEKSRLLVKTTSDQRESPLPVPEKPSAFHPRAQRNAFRRRDARLQSKSFGRKHDSAS